MGKTSRFFKSLLGFKSTDTPPPRSEPNTQPKRRWSFAKSNPQRHRNTSKSLDGNSLPHNHHHLYSSIENEDLNKHAITLAVATAAVVDAAMATAQAAAEVVRMTGRTTAAAYGVKGEQAAIKIQSNFRAYLARRALKALKALVKLQAVVRGHILRKQTTDMMRRLQALIRAQARAQALRSQIMHHDSTANPGPPTPEKFEHFPHTKHDHRSIILKMNNSKSYSRGKERTYFEDSNNYEHDKIVEVDTGRRFFQPDQISFGYSQSLTTSKGSTCQPTSSSPCASCEVNSFDDLVRGGVSTPIKSDGSSRCFSGYEDHPNYMANTESSRAKVRSLSAPRPRSQLEVSIATKRDSGYKYVSGSQQAPTLRESFAKRAYPGSGRLDQQLGKPVYDMMENEFCVGYWN